MQLVHMTGPRARPSAAGLRRDAMAMRRRRAGRQLRKESAVTQGDGPPFGTTSCLYSGPWHIPVPLGPSPCATTAFAATLGALLRLPMPQQGPGAWIQQLPIGCLSAMRCRFSSDDDPSDRQSHADIAPVASCCSPPKAQTPNRPKAAAAWGYGPSGTGMCHDPSKDRMSSRGMGHTPMRRRPPSEASAPDALAVSLPRCLAVPLSRQHRGAGALSRRAATAASN